MSLPLPGMRRVVITGLGLVSALGRDLAASWPALMSGAHAIAPIRRFDASRYTARLAAEVPAAFYDPSVSDDVEMPATRLGVRLFLQSAGHAWRAAGLGDARYPPERIGVAAGASVNYLHQARLREAWRLHHGEPPRLDVGRYLTSHPQSCNDVARRDGDRFASTVAHAVGTHGPRAVTDTACAASASAIVQAFRWIRSGRADAAVAGGGCAMVMPLGLLAFSRIGALTGSTDPDQASRPFDRDRDGFVMGEAGGAIVLEEREAARRRGATIYAELAGAGLTTSATSLTDPSPDGEPEARAMETALRDGAIDASQVDCVIAHGTSTPKNDATETIAIKRALGAHAREVLVSSNKGQLGHTLAAAGVCNVIVAALAVARGEVPPTANYRTPDPACDLDYVPNVGRRRPVRAALANAFAFGGHNVSIALTRHG